MKTNNYLTEQCFYANILSNCTEEVLLEYALLAYANVRILRSPTGAHTFEFVVDPEHFEALEGVLESDFGIKPDRRFGIRRHMWVTTPRVALMRAVIAEFGLRPYRFPTAKRP